MPCGLHLHRVTEEPFSFGFGSLLPLHDLRCDWRRYSSASVLERQLGPSGERLLHLVLSILVRVVEQVSDSRRGVQR